MISRRRDTGEQVRNFASSAAAPPTYGDVEVACAPQAAQPAPNEDHHTQRPCDEWMRESVQKELCPALRCGPRGRRAPGAPPRHVQGKQEPASPASPMQAVSPGRPGTAGTAGASSDVAGCGRSAKLHRRPWNRATTLSQEAAAKGQVKRVQGTLTRCDSGPVPHGARLVLHGKKPQNPRFPRSERFYLGTLGGAGGTRTQSGDASHLRRWQYNGHSHPFPSGRILLDPARTGSVRRSPHRFHSTPTRPLLPG